MRRSPTSPRPGPRLLLAALALFANACGSNGGILDSPPVVSITNPADGALVPAQTALTLSGTAIDAVDGALSGAALAWTSDRQGALGLGASLQVSLSAGPHVLTLTATNAHGTAGQAHISVTAQLVENQPPTVTITAPHTGQSFVEGAAITFTGVGTDKEDGTLAATSLLWSSSLDGSLGSGATVSATLSRGAHRIILAGTDKQGATAYATISVTVVGVGTNLPPVASIASPASGSSATVGAEVTLTGSANDPEDGAVPDARLAWTSSKDGALGTGATLKTSTLTLGLHTVKLTATDTHGLSGSAQILLSIVQAGNHAPTVAITAPTAGSAFFAGSAIAFAGSATDVEDGAIPAASLAWSSSRDGALGTGSTLSLSTLTVGSHEITLTATDSQSAQGAAQVTISVLAQNTAPAAQISSPADGSSFDLGQTVALRGAATDAEDGPLTGASLTWTSSLDGSLGHGASLDFSSLRAGAHTITFSAVDSGGRVGTAQVAIAVRPGTANLPPIARLSGPGTADAGASVSLDGSASNDPDGTLASYRFDFGDGTAAQVGTSKTATHTWQAPASVTVTLTVTDNQGATGSTTLALSIVKPAQVPVVADSGPYTLGVSCAIALDASGTPQVAYRELQHASVRWAKQTGATTWLVENVDGLGFEIGGEATGGVAMALDPSGNPHLAYRLTNGVMPGIWHSSRDTGWTREAADVTSASWSGDRVAIALDAANANRPVIAFSRVPSTTNLLSVGLAVRGATDWTVSSPRFGSHSTYEQLFEGGLVLSGGAAWLTFVDRYSSGYQGGIGLGSSGSGTPALFFSGASGPTLGTPLALRGGDPEVLLTNDLAHVSGALAAATVTLSPYSITAVTQSSLAVAADGTLWLAVKRSGNLELAHSADGNYWAYQNLGPMDEAHPSVAIAADGTARVCFFREGKLLVY